MSHTRPTGRPWARLKAFSARVIVPAVAVSVIAAGMTSAAANAAQAPGPQPSDSALSAVRMANLAGFAHIGPSQLSPSAPITATLLTPDLIIKLGPARGSAWVDDAAGVAITRTAGGSTIVAKADRTGLGFGIVTSQHGLLTYTFKALVAPGTTIKAAADGGLNQVTANGAVVARISPAYAVDSSGARFPASYRFNARTDELVVRANTTHAKGEIFIDPSWRCVLTVSAVGLAWLLAAAAWLFTDGVGAAFMEWALENWFRVSVTAADTIARACT